MQNKDKKEDSDKWLAEMPLQSDSKSFQTEELINCKKCQRSNPPTRLDCMYCGQELEFDKDQSQTLKPILRKVESYQNGYNLIYMANLQQWNDEQVTQVSKMTRQTKAKIVDVFQQKKILPIARAETEQETKIVSARLKEIGVETNIIYDEEFEMKKISKRLRRLDFQDDSLLLILFNSDEVIEVNRADINLIVIGAVFERKIESTEKYNKKEENKVLDTAEISSDEMLIDIYTKEELTNYRISPKGFDFSTLGNEKKLLAIENVKILISKLKNFATKARIDDEYLQIRSSLTDVWEVEMQTDSKGMERKSFGSFNRRSTISSDNLSQFTKYSRLQWIISKQNK